MATIGASHAVAASERIELVMVEQRGCIWCDRWFDEVGPAYAKTPEGEFAPLRMVNLHEPTPDDLTFDGRVVITPTFILAVDGREEARLEGYPGPDFFWGLLDRMLKENTTYPGGENG